MTTGIRSTAPRLAGAWLLYLLAAGLGSSCRSSGKTEIDPAAQLQMYRETALSHYENNDLPRAESQALKGLAIDKHDPQLRLLYGWINLRKGGTQDLLVVEKLFEGLDVEEDDRLTLGLAAAKERLGVVYQEAATSIARGDTKTKSVDPDQRVRELHQKSETSWRDAAKLYSRVLASKPENIQALNGMQRVDALRGEYEDSLVWTQKLLDITGREIQGWQTQIRMGDLNFEQEARLFRQSQDTQQLRTSTQMYAADVNRQLGRTEDALRYLDDVLAEDPLFATAYSRRAQLLQELGRFSEARDAIGEYLKHAGLEYDHPDVQRAYSLLTELERKVAGAR